MRSGIDFVFVLSASALMACASSTQAPSQQPALAPEPQPVALRAEPIASPEPTAAAKTPTPPIVGPDDEVLSDKTRASVEKLAAAGVASPGGIMTDQASTSRNDQNGSDDMLVSPFVVALNVTSAKGAMSSDAAQAVMEMARPNFVACAQVGAAHISNRVGAPLLLRFRINPKGSTSGTSLKGAGKDVKSCVTKLVGNLQFEPRRKPTKVMATITVEQVGSIAPGEGIGRGYGIASGAVHQGPKMVKGPNGYGAMNHLVGTPVKPPQVRIGKPVATGSLDKNLIRRFIRRQLMRVRHCYEKELVLQPQLAGTVTVNFTIEADGSVAKADARGVDPKVSDCVAKVIKIIQFPKPKGGGVVKVRYPFAFRPAGSSTG